MSPLNAAERQLLLVIWRATSRDAGSARRDLERIGHLEMRTTLDWTDAYFGLEKKGLVYNQDGRYLLTPEGITRSEWEHARHPFWAYTYDAFFSRAASSKAHSSFCTRVYGRDLCQHGIADVAQLDQLIGALAISEQDRVLELGCGNGMTAESISDQTGAHVTGVDISQVAIHQAQERTRGKRQRLTFATANMQELPFKTDVFDAAILIDVLYFVKAETTLERVLPALKPGAQMGILHTQWQREGAPRALLEPHQTDLARLLQKRGMDYSASDLSDAEEQLWCKMTRVLDQMQGAFEAEDNAWLYIFRLGEAKSHVNLGEWRRRYLYHVRLPVK